MKGLEIQGEELTRHLEWPELTINSCTREKLNSTGTSESPGELLHSTYAKPSDILIQQVEIGYSSNESECISLKYQV